MSNFGRGTRRAWWPVVVLFLAAAAHGQSFMIKPMKIELPVRAGQRFRMQIKVTSGDQSKEQTIEALTGLLGQSTGGVWTIVEPGDERAEEARARSCLDWLKLAQEKVTVKPTETVPVEFEVTVPRDARGTYSAGVLLRATNPPREGGVLTFVVQFLVPLIFSVQGAPARQDIRLADVTMEHVVREPDKPGTAILAAVVTNAGETYARVSATLTLYRKAGPRWSRVAEQVADERGSLPGNTIQLQSDLRRGLPSGQYRIAGELRVGGRVAQRLEKEFEFEGDPNVTTVAEDVSLLLDPPAPTAQVVPGSRRSLSVAVQNAGEEPVQLACGALVPEDLKGVSMGEITGESFSCAPWTTMAPNRFTLQPGQSQTVRIDLACPADLPPLPRYYADLLFVAAHMDGRSAGITRTRLVVENPAGKAEPNAKVLGVELSQSGATEYDVQVLVGNTGNLDWRPEGFVQVATSFGELKASAKLETDAGLVMPLGKPRLSARIDFAKVPAGLYLLKTTIDYAGQRTEHQLPVRVSFEQGTAVVTVVNQEG